MEYTIKINAQGLQQIIDALGQLPHHQVRNLIDFIGGQAQAQERAASGGANLDE